jgi:hypothetical protein
LHCTRNYCNAVWFSLRGSSGRDPEFQLMAVPLFRFHGLMRRHNDSAQAGHDAIAQKGCARRTKISMRAIRKTKQPPVGLKLKQLVEVTPARHVSVLLVFPLAVMGNGILAGLAWFLVGLAMRP